MIWSCLLYTSKLPLRWAIIYLGIFIVIIFGYYGPGVNPADFVYCLLYTSSGKSTLIQHMNGLLKATSGHIYYNGQDIYDNDYDLSKQMCIRDRHYTMRL